MSTPTEPIALGSRRVEDATCPACGLLCDDVALTVSGDRIVAADRACEVGRSWFLADHRRADRPAATIDGREVPIARAIDRAVDVLRRARAPIVLGLSSATTEAVAVAAILADRLGASIGPAHAGEAWPRIAAIQRAGTVSGSFGEVANRADVVLLWGVDPDRSHPRLKERLIDRPGRFVPGGRGGRTVLLAHDGSAMSLPWADEALVVEDRRHAEALRALRAAVAGIAVDPARVGRASGVPIDRWRAWADLLKAARYGAVLFGAGLAREGPEAIDALMRLLDELNEETRWVAVPLAGPGNPAGAEAVLTGRLGSPVAVDLADGSPRFLPDDADPEARLRRGEADAAIVVGDPPPGLDSHRPPDLPAVLIGPEATARSGPGIAAIATATPGIDDGGTLVRSDEVPLPLRPALAPIRPTDRDVLSAILARLRAS